MREILYRGILKADNLPYYHKGQWVYGDYVRLVDGKRTIPHIYGCGEIESDTVGQYTGLTDKNGKKIFEGDICKHISNYSGNTVISVVTYTDGCFLAMVDEHSGFELSDKLEVIGNVTDNPELLKGE